jgi:hypothetical protein
MPESYIAGPGDFYLSSLNLSNVELSTEVTFYLMSYPKRGIFCLSSNKGKSIIGLVCLIVALEPSNIWISLDASFSFS